MASGLSWCRVLLCEDLMAPWMWPKNLMGPKCGIQQNSTEAEGLLDQEFTSHSCILVWNSSLKLRLKESRVMECKKVNLYWGEIGKRTVELKVVVQWASCFAGGDSIPFCPLSTGFSTGVYCRPSCPCTVPCQQCFIWYLRPNRPLISRGLPSLLISATSLGLTYLLRQRSKRLKCLQQKNLPAGWRSSSQQCQRQYQRLGKRENLRPVQVPWKTVASCAPWTLERQLWCPQPGEVKPCASVMVSDISETVYNFCPTGPSTSSTHSVVLVQTPCLWKKRMLHVPLPL